MFNSTVSQNVYEFLMLLGYVRLIVDGCIAFDQSVDKDRDSKLVLFSELLHPGA